MATNIAKLKPTKSGKGTPPKADITPDIVAKNPRSEPVQTKPLQLKITPQEFDDFSRKAAETFGFHKGSKSKMFKEIWDFYQKNT